MRLAVPGLCSAVCRRDRHHHRAPHEQTADPARVRVRAPRPVVHLHHLGWKSYLFIYLPLSGVYTRVNDTGIYEPGQEGEDADRVSRK